MAVPSKALLFVVACALNLEAAPAPLALDRIPFRAELYPKNKSINFWAYHLGGKSYIPIKTLAKILNAKVHRYSASSSVVLSLDLRKSIEIKEGRKTIKLGTTALALVKPIAATPDQKDLLIPLESLQTPAFERYTEFKIEEDGNALIKFFEIEPIEPPKIWNVSEGLNIEFRLPSSKHYEITYHPDWPSALVKADPKWKIRNAKIPALAVRFSYCKLAPPRGRLPGGKAPAEAPAGRWRAAEDPNEKATVFYFPLDPRVSVGDIEAKEESWPSRRLKIQIMRQDPDPPAIHAPEKIAASGSKAGPKLRLHLKNRISSPLTAPVKRPPPLTKSRPIILIDPGHGGRDSGTISATGVQEKSINLILASKLQKHLKMLLPSAQIFLSRHKDLTLNLESRAQLTRKKNPNVFISIHANSARSATKSGYEIYIPASVTWDSWASEQVVRENRLKGVIVDQKTVPLRHVIRQSARLARAIEEALHRQVHRKIPSRGISKGDFYVLRETGVPAVLIETAFLTHKNDLKLIQNSAFQDTVARSIAQGVALYFREKPN
ncbi:MAG: N-acetylmuramoyl-L-alanine amidase [Elusimicrobiota bacterium]